MPPGPLVRDFGPQYDQKDGQQPYLDIEELVTNVQNLYILTKPFIHIIEVISDLLRWKNPGFSLLLLSIWNIGCLSLGVSYQLVIVIITAFFVGCMGYLHRETHCLSKVLPSTSKGDHESRKHTERDDDHIQEFKAILWQTNRQACRWIVICHKIYSVLEWEDPVKTARIYGVCLFFSVAALMLPVTWSTALVVNYFFIGNMIDYIFQYFEEKKKANSGTNVDGNVNLSANPEVVTSDWDSKTLDSLDTSSIPTDDSDSEYSFPQDVTLEADGSYKDFEILENPEPPRHDVEITTEENKAPVETKSTKAEISNKDNTPSTCSGCGATFTSILKRRKNCSNCGNHFCGKCCSYKVLRSLFGATSPAAQTETVSVCRDCYDFLTVTADKESVKDKAV